MPSPRQLRDAYQAPVARETGRPFPKARQRLALAYPSPYRAGMSSLGYQWIGSVLSEAGFGVERIFLPDDVEAWRTARISPYSLESGTSLADFPLIAISVAYELEIAGLVELLRLARIPPLRKDRTSHHPKILVGGPLTFSNPLPCAPFADAMIWGEGEAVIGEAVAAFFADGDFDALATMPGGWLPGMGRVPVAKANDDLLPARSRIMSPDAELHDMFLIEGERGCHRTCTFCVMRRSTNGGMRLVTPAAIMGFVPAEAKRVGLVGAAISDHPELVGVIGAIVDSGRGVGISSLRADRVALKPDIPRLLRAGGYATLTVASDAASQRLRRTIAKGTTEAHLLACAEAAKEHHYRLLKVYMMVGLPGEEDDDIEELLAFTRKLAAIHPVTLGIAPFVPKFATPLVDAPFAGIGVVESRLAAIRGGLKGSRADLRPTSARWAWVEYRLAQGGEEAGLAVLTAVLAGGTFGDYKRALTELPERHRAATLERRAEIAAG